MTKLAVDYRGAIFDLSHNELASIEDTFTCDMQDDVADAVLNRMYAYSGVRANLTDIAEALTNLHYYNQPCMDTAAYTVAVIKRVHIAERY